MASTQQPCPLGQPPRCGQYTTLRSTSTARLIPSFETSRCVTARMLFAPVPSISTPSVLSRSSSIGTVSPGSAYSEVEDIGHDGIDIDVEATDVGDAPGQPLGVQVIFGETFDVVLQGIDPCCRQDAGLPHATAELLAEAMSPLHKFLRPDH